ISFVVNIVSGDFADIAQILDASLRIGISIMAFPIVAWLIIVALLELKESSKGVTLVVKYIGVAALMAGLSLAVLFVSRPMEEGGISDLSRALFSLVATQFFASMVLASLLSILWVKRPSR